MEAYEIKQLSFTYPEAKTAALENINVTIQHGEFIVICGKSGCGKSTLLQHLKTILTPHGQRCGEVLFEGQWLETIEQRQQVSEIGYVMQSPDGQIVTDKVWHELAFGLESLGYDNQTIRLRVAEMASFFGIQSWFMKNTMELSGGQKQLLNLASIMAMQPSVLILDEPTSQLDPIAASDFLETIKKINRELGTTIIMTEHRLEEVFTVADKAMVMEDGKVLFYDAPYLVGEQLKKQNHDLFSAMPSPMQIYAGVENQLHCPITVKEGRQWMNQLFLENPIEHTKIQAIEKKWEEDTVIELKEVWFKYEKNAMDIVKDLHVKVQRGQLYCLVGGNGTGKTTTLSLIHGIYKPYRGKIKIAEPLKNKVAMLPQNPQSLFVHHTVELDLLEVAKKKDIMEIAKLTQIEGLMEMHPYDLSGGEQQRVALAKVLLTEPEILLLDEPTKGLDSHFKGILAKILKDLQKKKVTIVMVSHDIEFCAKYGDRCAMFFNGGIVAENTPNEFFSGNSFYTTAANRMSRHLFKNAVNVEDVIDLCKKNQ